MATGRILTSSDVRDWAGSKLLVAEDTNGNKRVVAVNAAGEFLVSAELEVGDIQIGAVEIKNHDSDVRASVAVEGAVAALYVQSISLASQATLAALLTKMTDKLQMAQITDGTNQAAVIATILSLKSDLSSVKGTVTDVNSGDKSNGSQRVVVATDDVNASAVKTATEKSAAAAGAAAAAVPTNTVQVGGRAESAPPAAVTDGQLAALAMTLFRRQKIAGYDDAQSAVQIVDTAPAQMQAPRYPDWDALTAPGQETPAQDVSAFENHTIEYIIATIDDSVDLIVWGSIDDGATWFVIDSWTVLDTDLQTDVREIGNFKVQKIKCEFDGEAGGAAAVVTFKHMHGC